MSFSYYGFIAEFLLFIVEYSTPEKIRKLIEMFIYTGKHRIW